MRIRKDKPCKKCGELISRSLSVKARYCSDACKDLWWKDNKEDLRKRISDGRKKYLKENPDKHPWKNNNKFKSSPCEHLKKKFRDENISFVEEYTPQEITRNFSIDIAFPDEKIGIEVNGNQHYDSVTGELNDYNKERLSILNEAGWKIINLHYTKAYSFDVMEYKTFIGRDYIYFTKKKTVKCNICGVEYVKTKKNGIKTCGSEECKTKIRVLAAHNRNRNPGKETLDKIIKQSIDKFERLNITWLAEQLKIGDTNAKLWLLDVYDKEYLDTIIKQPNTYNPFNDIKVCLCGVEFVPYHQRSRYCSQECFKRYRFNKNPGKEVLGEHIARSKEMFGRINFCWIGKQFNVSDNAVRRWFRKFGLSMK